MIPKNSFKNSTAKAKQMSAYAKQTGKPVHTSTQIGRIKIDNDNFNMNHLKKIILLYNQLVVNDKLKYQELALFNNNKTIIIFEVSKQVRNKSKYRLELHILHNIVSRLVDNNFETNVPIEDMNEVNDIYRNLLKYKEIAPLHNVLKNETPQEPDGDYATFTLYTQKNKKCNPITNW